MTFKDPQIIHTSNGEELVVLTRAAYDALLAAAADDKEDDADLVDTARAAKADWEAAGRPTIALQVYRRVRAGESYLRAFRAEKGWSRSKLAQEAGISQGQLSAIESSRKAPDEATRDVLAKALGIHPIWLSEDAPESSREVRA